MDINRSLTNLRRALLLTGLLRYMCTLVLIYKFGLFSHIGLFSILFNILTEIYVHVYKKKRRYN